MIFRRFSEPTPAPRKNASTGKQSLDTRREPSLQARPAPATTNAQTQHSQNGPVSPIAVAQARRTQPSTPASNFSGKDQSRKLTVGRDISLSGEIETCDHLVVEGTIKATVKNGKMLEISESGSFAGAVDIEQADIAGRFEGELLVRGKLIIRPTATVIGTLYYNRLQVDTGAIINAQLNTLEEQTLQNNQPQANATAQTMPSNTHSFSLASLNDEPGFLRTNSN